MTTPTRISRQDFFFAIEKWLNERCIVDRGKITCKACGDQIQSVNALISIHSTQFVSICAGTGEVRGVRVPYCPKCEQRPATAGCFHEDIELPETVIVDLTHRREASL
jgi:hypothetical protein